MARSLTSLRWRLQSALDGGVSELRPSGRWTAGTLSQLGWRGELSSLRAAREGTEHSDCVARRSPPASDCPRYEVALPLHSLCWLGLAQCTRQDWRGGSASQHWLLHRGKSDEPSSRAGENIRAGRPSRARAGQQQTVEPSSQAASAVGSTRRRCAFPGRC